MSHTTKHTKGPWNIDKYNTVTDSQGNTVRTEGFALSMRNDDETKANARLMASAPLLLEALQMARKALVIVSSNYDVDMHLDMAEKAIAKALGE